MWGGDEPSLPLVLGGGGSSPHLHMLVNLIGLVTWPSDGVSWRSWAVGAIDNGGNSDVVVGTGVMDSGVGLEQRSVMWHLHQM